MGRLWSIQGLPLTMPHGMVKTPHGVDLAFLFFTFLDLYMLCSCSSVAALRCLLVQVTTGILLGALQLACLQYIQQLKCCCTIST